MVQLSLSLAYGRRSISAVFALQLQTLVKDVPVPQPQAQEIVAVENVRNYVLPAPIVIPQEVVAAVPTQTGGEDC